MEHPLPIHGNTTVVRRPRQRLSLKSLVLLFGGMDH
jgi:hypothetical protein